MSDPQARVIAGRYRLTSRLGSGAMGAVWLATDELLHRTVAVKELLLPAGLDAEAAEQARQRALREGRIAARMRHVNAINVYDVVDDAGRPVLIMEYLPSHSLADVLAERGSLPPKEVARIGSEMAAALNAAHNVGVVHRDVKPANILLGEHGACKLTDFGISRATGDITVTTTGLITGSPAYLSPEAARGAEPGPASDVFSLGATLYRAVEGRLPFGEKDNSIAVLHAVAAGQIDPMEQAGPLTEALTWMLQPDPADRPGMPQVQELLATVAVGGVGTDSGGFPPPPTAPAKNGRSRRGAYAAAGLAAAVIAAGITVGLTVDWGPKDAVAGSASGATTTSTNGPDSTTTTTTRKDRPSQTVGPEEFEATVAEFYEVMPENIDAGWALLTPKLQDVGRERFDKYWGSLGPIIVTEPPKTVDGKVIVGFEVVYADLGKVFFQRNEIGVVVQDGRPKINSMKQLTQQRLDD